MLRILFAVVTAAGAGGVGWVSAPVTVAADVIR
jgi:hypothetical protein